MELMFYLIVFLSLLAIGYFVGKHLENQHLQQLIYREYHLKHMIVSNSKNLPQGYPEIDKSGLVAGNVVISFDYYKRFVASIFSIIGGEVKPFHSLMERAKREAILRMKEKAHGADMIINVRLETSDISTVGLSQNSIGSFEVIAYGTAIKFKKDASNTQAKTSAE